MPGAVLALLFGILGAGVAAVHAHRLQRTATGRTPDDPLPAPSGALPPEGDLVLPEMEPADPDRLAVAFRAAAPTASSRAVRILVAHALVAGGGLVINGNVLWLPAKASSSASAAWTMAVVEAITPEGIRYRLRPVRAFSSWADGAAAAISTLPPAARVAAQRGDVAGYVAALVAARATAREPRRFARDLRAAVADLRPVP